MADTLVYALAQPPATDSFGPLTGGSGFRMLLASVIVLGLLGLWAWLMRRGTFKRSQQGAVSIETAVPLGERRSLVIVSIEGRRLLLGLTPTNVSLVTSLEPLRADFGDALDRVDQDTAQVS